MKNMEIDNISKRTANSILMLISRSGIMQLISLFGVFALTIFLSPSELGTFMIVNSLLGIMVYFSDIGLSASLIQQKHQPKIEELRTAFSVQQGLIIVLITIGYLLTNFLSKNNNWDQNIIFLWWAILAGFFLASLKTIPSVLVERNLKFEKLVLVETIETIVFYGIACWAAWKGSGVSSYTWAVLARGLVGAFVMYILVPWPMGIGWDKSAFRSLIKFGLPFQLNSFIAALKDNLLNVILGHGMFLGREGLGILGWGQTWTQKPLRFITDNVTRATFPAFSRIQDDKEKIARGVNRMLFVTSITVFPAVMLGVVQISKVVEIIPQYEKWSPGVVVFYWLSINSIWASISTPMTNILAAIGRIRYVTGLMIMWTVLTWAIIPLGAKLYGYQGAAIGTALISFASIVPLVLVKKFINYNFIQSVYPGIIGTLLILIFGKLINHLVAGLLGVIISTITSIIIFGLVIYGLRKNDLNKLWQYIYSK